MHPMEQEVIPVKDTNKTIRASKIILIPVFLVPLLMNEGQPKNPIEMFHQFYDTFWEHALPKLKECTQHIFDFLLMATGFDEDYDGDELPTSQLAIRVCELCMDSTLETWGRYHMQDCVKLARKFDKKDTPKKGKKPGSKTKNMKRYNQGKVTSDPISELIDELKQDIASVAMEMQAKFNQQDTLKLTQTQKNLRGLTPQMNQCGSSLSG